MKKYKYIVVEQGIFDWSSIETFINQYARMGWRLVSVTIHSLSNETRFYFEKEI
jgi:hypothetical protein